jgi:hypothetical protein
MGKSMRRCLTPFLAAALLVVPTFASADQVNDSAVRLGFDVEAVVSGKCGFDRADVSSQLSALLTDAKAGETRQVRFSLSCNTPFTVRVQSRNGALVADLGDTDAVITAQGEGFSTEMNYGVSLDVPLVDMAGHRFVEQSTCQSATSMQIGSSTCALARGDGVTFMGTSDVAPATLTVKLDPPTGPLIAGVFSDYITIDVGFAL